MLRDVLPVRAERRFDLVDGLPRLPPPERELAEAGEGGGALTLGARMLERLRVEAPGELELVESQGKLRLEEAFAIGPIVLAACRQSSRRSWSDGIRSPASIREMYAGEHPGNASCRWLTPACSRAALRRAPTALGSST
jgi:hypothetical protein